MMKNILAALSVFLATISFAQASDGSDSAWEISAIILYAVLVIVALWVSFWLLLLPVRLAKGKSNYNAVVLLTALTLLTGVTWFIALYMALQPDPKAGIDVNAWRTHRSRQVVALQPDPEAAIDVTESRAAAEAAKIVPLRWLTRAPQPRVIPPPPGAQRTYRIASNGKDLGEFSVSAIKQLLEAGKLTMQDYYFDHDSNDW